MILYHFTSRVHLERILDAGFLKLCESNISKRRPHAGPAVVWLTSNPDPSANGNGLSGSAVDKRAIRITVEVGRREAVKWRPWAVARGIEPDWMRILASAGGSNTWWVATKPIQRADWREVRDLENDVPIEF